MSTPIENVVDLALSQDGDQYIFGAEASVSDSNPDAFDCSELVQWSCGRALVVPLMPDGSWYQARHCKNNDTLLTVQEGIDTYGALLFKFSSTPFEGGRPSNAHVAFSLGNGSTIEARSTLHGVGLFPAEGRGWTHAGLIPGCDYRTRVYRDVANVPEYDWAENVIDRSLERKIINTADNYPDDWNDADVTMGRLWVLIDRAISYMEGIA